MSQHDDQLADTRFYDFGPFRVDARNRLLLRDGEVVPLASKVFDILLVFVRRSGTLLDKELLMREVWPGSFVEEGNLTRNVSTLRKALGEAPNEHRYIVTVPGHGYRFVGEVTETPRGLSGPIAEERSESRAVVDATGEREAGERVLETEPGGDEPLAGDRTAARAPGWRARRRMSAASLVLAAVCCVAVPFLLVSETSPGEGGVAIRSVAVLPFQPLVPARRNEAVEMGMAETLINKLSGMQRITVRSINSVRRYGALDRDALAAGRELGVDAVLEGSIQWEGDKKIRVTWRLLRVRDGATLGFGTCDEQCEVIFAAQDAIARRVAETLALKLSSSERKLLAKHDTENADAYQLYLKGRYFWNKRASREMLKSAECFRRAIEIDPSYALAYAGLADAYTSLGSLGVSPPHDVMPGARAAAAKALEIDESLSEAHVSLAIIQLSYDWDWAAAETAIKRAIELDPDNVTARMWHANYLFAVGRFDEATAEMAAARTLDPLSLLVHRNYGRAFYYARDYDQAAAIFEEVVDTEPGFPVVHNWLSWTYERKGMRDEAIEADLKMRAIDGTSRESIAALRAAYAASGWTGYWRKALELSKEERLPAGVNAYLTAQIHARLGNREQAFEWLRRAYDERSLWMVWLKVDPTLDSLHSDPRFDELVRRVGIPS